MGRRARTRFSAQSRALTYLAHLLTYFIVKQTGQTKESPPISRAAPSLFIVGMGTVAWIVLGALPGRHELNPGSWYRTGGFYPLAIFAMALLLGVFRQRGTHLMTAWLLIAPAVLL